MKGLSTARESCARSICRPLSLSDVTISSARRYGRSTCTGIFPGHGSCRSIGAVTSRTWRSPKRSRPPLASSCRPTTGEPGAGHGCWRLGLPRGHVAVTRPTSGRTGPLGSWSRRGCERTESLPRPRRSGTAAAGSPRSPRGRSRPRASSRLARAGTSAMSCRYAIPVPGESSAPSGPGGSWTRRPGSRA